MPALNINSLAAIAKQLNIISLLTYLVPLLIGVRRWHSLSRTYRPLVWLVLISGCILNTLSEISRSFYHNNILFGHIIIWADTLILSWTYYYALHYPRLRIYILVTVFIFVVLSLIESFYWRSLWHGFNNYTHVAQSILLVSLALLYFEQTLRDLHDIKLEQDPMFLVSVGVIVYYSGTIVMFLLEADMHRQQQNAQIWVMYIIQFILLIIFNTLLSLALYRASENKKQVNRHIW